MEERNGLNLCSPTQAERLGTFASRHFLFSIMGSVVLVVGGLIGLELESQYGYEVFFALLIFANLLYLAIYILLGRWAAKEKGWVTPASFWEGGLAFLFPALIAWAWGGLVLGAATIPGSEGYELATAVIWISFIFASPSFLMVFTAFACGWMDGGLINMILCVLVVGGLPPLLFLLGSIWGGRKAERRAICAEEEQEGNDGTS